MDSHASVNFTLFKTKLKIPKRRHSTYFPQTCYHSPTSEICYLTLQSSAHYDLNIMTTSEKRFGLVQSHKGVEGKDIRCEE